MALSQSLFTLQVGFIGFVVGLVFWRFPPKKINSVYGYRTPRSQKDIASWRFAQRFSAKLMVWTGLANMGICRVCDSVLCRMDLPGRGWRGYTAPPRVRQRVVPDGSSRSGPDDL